MNISALSIRYPVPAVLIFVLMCAAGLYSFQKLGVQNYPEFEFPAINVNAVLEGAAPAQLESDVARKLEDKIATIGRVQHIRTTITNGLVSMMVIFEMGKDTNEALNEVRNAVDSVRSDLPADLQDPVVSKVDTAGKPILTYTVESRHMNEKALSWFVDDKVTRALLSVKGVGRIHRIGGVDREIHVDLDPTLMAGLGVTASQVSRQLLQVQQDASGGRGDVGSGLQSVRTLAAATNPAQVGAITIPLGNGRHVRLDQIAHVSDTIAERTAYARLDGKPVVGFDVTRLRGASEVDVANAVRAAMKEFGKEHPDVQIHEVINSVQHVEESFKGSMHMLYEGAFLAVIVVFWFLRNVRATLVSAAALPLSIIPTFAIMYLSGFTLNTLTLLALSLIVGVLVDDAIVEIENIVRHLNMGKTPYQAAMEAADEIGMAVIATTFTLVGVFLPTAFMGGIAGQFFRCFGVTTVSAVLMSLMVARLLTPMMAAYLLKPLAHPTKQPFWMERYMGWVQACLTHRKTTVAAAALFFFASLALIRFLPTDFLPAADTDQTSITLELQPGSTLEDTLAVSQQAQEMLRKIPNVEHVFANVGTDPGDPAKAIDTSSADTRMASLTAILKPRAERNQTKAQIDAKIREVMATLPGTRVAVGSGNGQKLEITLVSNNAHQLNQTANKINTELRGIPNIGNVVSSAGLQRPEIHVDPDPVRAAELGVTTQEIARVVRVATAGDFSADLPKLNLPERQLPIRVEFAPGVRDNLDAIGQLRVHTNQGDVPLASIARLSMGSGPAQITRLDRRRNVTLNVELNGQPMSVVSSAADKLPTLNHLPPGVYRESTGDQEQQQELFDSFEVAMVIGIFCIYSVLVLLFHDFMQPATIMAALPLSIGGAFVALLVTRHSISLSVVIGLLMLMGIVTKNSILLVEYAVIARREHGMSRFNALLDACHKRSRPILMTTIAMGAGMLPVAMGVGSDASFRSPMAVSVIGGLITSTFLSLLVVPVVFTYVDDVLQWLARIFIRRDTAMPTALAQQVTSTTPQAKLEEEHAN